MTDKRYENIHVIDENKKIIFSAIQGENHIDSESQQYVEKVLNSVELAVRDYYFCEYHQRVHYELFAPVVDQAGKALAIMLFSINPTDFIYPLLSDWPTESKSSETILIRNEGDSVRFLNNLKKADNSRLSLVFSLSDQTLPSINAFTGNEGLFTGIDYAGDKVLVDRSVIKGTQYAIVNKVDIAELYADFYKQSVMIFIITALFILLVGLFVAWYYNTRQKGLFRKLLQKSNELEDREEQYRLIMDNSLDAIMLTSPDGSILSVNKAAEQMFGMSAHELCQKGRQGIVDYSNPQSKALFDQREETGKARGEMSFVRKDGSTFFAEVSSSIFKSAQGNLRAGIIIRDITDRKLAETQIKQEKNILRTLIDSLPDSIFVKDAFGRKLISNKADLEHMACNSEKEVIGKTDLELYNNVDGKAGYEEDIQVINSGKAIINKEVSFTDSKGNKHWRMVSKVPLFDQQNNVTGLVGYAHDFTLRKEMELQLQYSEETIRLLFNSTAEGIYGLDNNGICIFCNKSAMAMLGFGTENEVLGHNMHSLIHSPENNDSVCEISKTYQQGVKNHSVDKIFSKKDGSLLPVEYWSYPIMRDGKIIGAVVTFVDITLRKHHEKIQRIQYEIARKSVLAKSIEELLLDVKEQLSTVIDTSNFYVASFLKNSNTLKQIIFINETISSEEWPVEGTLSGLVVSSGESILANSNYIEQFYIQRKSDPSYIMAKSWLGVPLKHENEIFGVMVVQSYHSDNAFNLQHKILLEMIAHELETVIQRNKMINDLIVAKNKAEESDRLKSAFLANVSHEIRTPMNGILGFLELLTEPDLSENQKEMYLDIMNKSGQRLLETINDIIELSKIESGQMNVNIEAVNIYEILEFQYKFFTPKVRAKGIEIQFEHENIDKGLNLFTDKVKLNGILTNLMNNALKYTDEGKIKIGAIIEVNRVVFFVEDTGIGIPSDKQLSIFERFNQVDNRLTRTKEGAGLGLSIVKAYIQLLNGEIWLESELGKGSCFYFSLPLKSEIN
jgi:PAS domain S-box-containing protein